MTSQDPPLTRRELRERERLQQAQEAAPATPEPVVAPAAPVVAPAAQVSPAAPAWAELQREASPVGISASNSAHPVAPLPASMPPAGVSPMVEAAQVAPASSRPLPTPPERTLTRRELRAMLEAEHGSFDDLELEDDPVPASPAPKSSAPLTGERQSTSESHHGQSDPVSAFGVHGIASAEAGPVSSTSTSDTSDGETGVRRTPGTPFGHWTMQLDQVDDAPEPFDQLLSRGIASGGVPTTSNALILPTIPGTGSMHSVGSNGPESLATGSIDLPASVGARGTHPNHIDSTDIDRLFDQQVEDSTGSAAAPVSATRAISTQSANRTMMAPPTKEGMNVPFVLAATAGVLALGVVATLVVGAVAGLF